MKKGYYFLFFFLLIVLSAAVPAKKSLPNILFILVDDLGYYDLSFTGSQIYQTPNVDRLAKKSLFFEQAYSSYPRCVPSRYGMITGTYPVNENNGYLAGIPSENNFIRQFSLAGYRTSYVGKWHLGTDENSPSGYGFDHSFAAGHSGGAGSHFYPFNVLDEKGKNKDGDGARAIEDVEERGKAGDYLADLLTEETLNFIRSNGKKQPFMAMLSFYAVHTPLEAKLEDRIRNQEEIEAFDFGNTPEYIPESNGRRKMRQDNADYAGMVENMDYNVGRLLDLLEALKLEKNTIVIFTSDHGGLSNDGNGKRLLATTNYPLRAGKGHLYEGGIRVPLMVYWHKKFQPGIDHENIILGMDLFPTLQDMILSKSFKGIDGLSYYPVLEGKKSWKDRTVFWHESKARPKSTGESPCSVVRSGDYKLMHFYTEDRTELYNLRRDISETQNLEEEQPEKVKELMGLLNSWKAAYLIPAKIEVKKNGKTSKNNHQ